MIIKISEAWRPGQTINETIDVCKNICRLTEDFTLTKVIVITFCNEVPLVIRKDWPNSAIHQDYRFFENQDANNRQDLIDRRIAELTEGC